MKLSRHFLARFACLFAAMPSCALAYETQTHAYLTSKAFNISDLGNSNAPAVLMRLGIDRLDKTVPFSIYWETAVRPGYYDNMPDGAEPLTHLRFVADFERIQMQQLADPRPPWIPIETVESSQGPSIPKLPIANWLLRGAIREDDLKPGDYNPKNGPPPDPDPRGPFERVFNHFYDPIDDIKLSPFGISCTLIPGSGGHCDKAVDFALGTRDAFSSLSADPARNNHFSWADARQNMFLALTAERDANGDKLRSASERELDAEERLNRWATTFRALGDVLHLLEDMGQPQHSRNDRHDPYTTYLDPERQAFESFTNARLIGAGSVGGADPTQGELYVRGLAGLLPSQNYVTPPSDADGYPAVWMATPLRYFTTRQKNDTASTDPSSRLGLADYTNRGFFTRGTLPGSGAFPLPPTPLSDTNGYATLTSVCDDFPTLFGRKTMCRRYAHVVPDHVQPNRADAKSTIPLVVEGLWFRNGYRSSGDFAIGPPIFQVQADLAFPRAIGYSAGLINYFFRGQLTLTAPPRGLYSVVDQGTPHTVNAQGYPCVGTATNDGCPIFGFTTVRVRVKNGTPDIVESGSGTRVAQTMQSGKLVAVARYHRNPCYQADLSGEYVTLPDGSATVPAGCSVAQTRTPYQEISVSAALDIDVHGNFSGSNNGYSACANVGNVQTGATGSCEDAGGVLAEFDFSGDPIPVNATDLFLQVVYRGPLGQEADGIAVGMKDILEPNFYTVWNNTDRFLDDGNWSPALAPPSPYASTSLQAAIVCFADQAIEGLSTEQKLEPVQFFRTAVLAEPQPIQFGGILQYDDGAIAYLTDGPTAGVARQATSERGSDYAESPIPVYARGIPTGLDFFQAFRYRGNYTQQQYRKLLTLTPTLGSPQAGIPKPVIVEFTSETSSTCAGYFPGPYGAP